jgi:uncharacterized protein YggE
MQPQDQPFTAQSQAPFVSKQKKSPNLWQVATILFLIIILAMVVIWKPWEPNIKASERTISVTGNATVNATPDQYIFSPNYQFTNADKQTALSQLSAKNDTIVGQLKSLGVPSTGIKTDSSGYGGGYYSVTLNNGNTTYTLRLTITVNDAKLAQKVQDYLLATSPTGQVSPEVSFSDAKQQQLQNQARSQAEKDAKSQADQSAANLGFKVDKVKSVTDNGLGGGGCLDICARANSATGGANQAMPKLTIQPGQNQVSYSVDVVYYIH